MVRSQKGFTIIELVVVIVILGILAAVAFPKFENLSSDARTAVLNGGAAAIRSAAVIQFAKNSGQISTGASIVAATNLDGGISATNVACAVTLNSGGTTLVVNVSTEYCSG